MIESMPRMHAYVRLVITAAVAYLAVAGAFAIYDGHASFPRLWFVGAYLVGAAVAAARRP